MPRKTTSATRSAASGGAKSSKSRSAVAGAKGAVKGASKKAGAKGAAKKAGTTSTRKRAPMSEAPRDGDSAERDAVQHHRWIVDVIEEGSAAVEVDGRQVTPLPRWLLPVGARQGDVLAVTHRREDTRSVLTVEIDRAATKSAYGASAEQAAEGKAASTARDPGGDIAL